VSAMFKSLRVLAAIGAVVTSAGCGDMATDSRSPVQLTLAGLSGAAGATPDELGATLLSDVLTNVQRTINGQQVEVPTVFNDVGEASFFLVLKDPGSNPANPASPTPLNSVTINRYRVGYRRTDGRNTPGVDVPYPFDAAVTVTVGAEGATAGFQLVRISAKQEAPLRALVNNPDIISTIADVTFYGRDQAGNDVSVTGSITVDFGNFGDPQ
jgi:hypothetical protein